MFGDLIYNTNQYVIISTKNINQYYYIIILNEQNISRGKGSGCHYAWI